MVHFYVFFFTNKWFTNPTLTARVARMAGTIEAPIAAVALLMDSLLLRLTISQIITAVEAVNPTATTATRAAVTIEWAV